MPHYVIAGGHTDQWKALPFNTDEGRGIAVFEDEERAQRFVDANRESLGPGWEPKPLWVGQLVDVLERHAAEEDVHLVVMNPPAVPVASLAGTHEVEVAEIEDYVRIVRKHYGL